MSERLGGILGLWGSRRMGKEITGDEEGDREAAVSRAAKEKDRVGESRR